MTCNKNAKREPHAFGYICWKSLPIISKLLVFVHRCNFKNIENYAYQEPKNCFYQYLLYREQLYGNEVRYIISSDRFKLIKCISTWLIASKKYYDRYKRRITMFLFGIRNHQKTYSISISFNYPIECVIWIRFLFLLNIMLCLFHLRLPKKRVN